MRSIVVAAAIVVGTGFAWADPVFDAPSLRATLPDDAQTGPAAAEDGSSRHCGTRDALFAGGGQNVWVTRLGVARWHNPLRPVAPEPLQVVQVAVNGRAGTAFGPDFENLRQGEPGSALEGVEGTRWSGEIGEAPAEMRVVADDGRVLIGPLPFVTCGEAPKVTRASARTDRRRAPPVDADAIGAEKPALRPVRRDAAPRPPALPIPQGAIR